MLPWACTTSEQLVEPSGVVRVKSQVHWEVATHCRVMSWTVHCSMDEEEAWGVAGTWGEGSGSVGVGVIVSCGGGGSWGGGEELMVEVVVEVVVVDVVVIEREDDVEEEIEGISSMENVELWDGDGLGSGGNGTNGNGTTEVVDGFVAEGIKELV